MRYAYLDFSNFQLDFLRFQMDRNRNRIPQRQNGRNPQLVGVDLGTGDDLGVGIYKDGD